MKYQRGNALIYILIGVALFAALSYTFSRNASTGSTNLTNEQVTLYANQLINQAQQMEQVVQQMLMTGSTIDDIDFTKPGEAGYGTNAQHQVYHPSGGGMNYSIPPTGHPIWDPDLSATYNRGWLSETSTNVVWTKTTENDIIYTFLDLDRPICEKINEIISGNTNVPTLGLGVEAYFNEASSSSDLNETNCPGCEGNYRMCVENGAQSTQAFYNIIASE